MEPRIYGITDLRNNGNTDPGSYGNTDLRNNGNTDPGSYGNTESGMFEAGVDFGGNGDEDPDDAGAVCY